MLLHPTVIEKLITIYTNYGGYREEHRLRTELTKLDLQPYEQQTGERMTFLVLTEEVQKYLDSLIQT